MPTVDVPNLGLVDFPEGTSDEDISSAIDNHLQNAVQTAVQAPQQVMSLLERQLTAAVPGTEMAREQGKREQVFIPSMTFEGIPTQMTDEELKGFNPPQDALVHIPHIMASDPRFQAAMIGATGQMPTEESASTMAALANQAGGLAQFAVSPQGIGTMGLGAAGGPIAKALVAAGYAGQMAAEVPEAAREAGRLSVEGTPQERKEAYLGLGANIILPGLLGAEAITKGAPYARSLKEAAKVHGDLHPQPERGPGEMTAQEGGAGVQPQAEAVAKEAQVPLTPTERGAKGPLAQPELPLTPEEDAAQKAERDAIDEAAASNKDVGLPSEVADVEPTDENAPFAHELATVDDQGRIVLNRANVRQWLSKIPEANRQNFLNGLFSEEGIHAVARKLFGDEEMSGLWNSLTGAERSLVERSYFGKERETARAKYTDAQMGHEYLRRQMQRLLRMDPREVTEQRGRPGFLKEKVIDAIERVITAVRRKLGTKASTQLDSMLNHMQDNVDTAKGLPIKGQAPSAFAKPGRPDSMASDIDELRFTIQNRQIHPDTGEPMEGTQYVQVDGMKGGKNMYSTNPKDLRALGFKIPDEETLQRLPSGRYSEMELLHALSEEKGFGMPQLKPGMVRLYHGEGGPESAGMGSLWFSQNLDRAATYGPNVSYVDVPEEIARDAQEAVRKTGRGTRADHVLPDEWVLKAKPLPDQVKQRVHEIPEEAPAAYAKGRKPKEGELFIPPVGGQLTRPETRPATEFAVEAGQQLAHKPITPQILEDETLRHLTESAAPNFETFVGELRQRYGDLKPGQLRDVWQDQVWKRLLTASGTELQNMVKGLNLERVVGSGKVADALKESPIGFQLESESTGELRAEEKPLSKEARELQRSQQNRRANVMARIGEKLIGESETGRKAWQRKEISPDEIADPRQETKQPVYQHITTEDHLDPDNLGRILTDDARAFGGAKVKKVVGGKPIEITQKGLPVSVTKRVTAIQNKASGKVSLVSTYRDPRRGAVLLDPQSPGQTHSPIASMLERYRVLNSVLLDEPVQSFRKDFKDIRDYSDKFGEDARIAAQKFAGYEEPLAEGAPEPLAAWEAGGPVTDAEASAIMDHILGEVGRFDSPDDVKLALEPLQAGEKNRMVVSGLRKIGAEIMRKEPDLDQGQFLDKLANTIYENHNRAKTLEEFQRLTIQSAGAPAGEAAGLASKSVKGIQRPAAFAKQRELADETFQAVKRSIVAGVKRRTVARDIPRMLDGADGTAAQFALGAGNHIRVQSKNPMVRGAVKVLIATGQTDKAGNWNPTKNFLPKLYEQLEAGELRARDWAQHGNPIQKQWSKKWQAAIDHAREELRFAEDHWNDPELRAATDATRKELHDTIEWENANGSDIQERENHFPGRYEGEFWSDNGINFGPKRILGTQFRLKKKFANNYEALANGPYIPASWDAADVVEHRVRAGHRIIERKMWQDAIKGIRDPVSGKPVAKDPLPVMKDKTVTDLATGVTANIKVAESWKSPSPDYVLVQPFQWQKPIAVLEGFAKMVDSTASRSRIDDLPFAKPALIAASQLKHGVVLLVDTFHPARLGQYTAALLGTKSGWRGGLTALAYRAEDMPDAVRQGYISQESADWALSPVEVNVTRRGPTTTGFRTVTQKIQMSRADVAKEMIKQGLNAAKITDALYRDAVQNIPIVGQTWHKLIGPYNELLFGKFAPGIMIETAVRNFEKYNAANPTTPVHTLMKDVIRDTNAFYGNMGRQGIFRNATFRDLAQIFLLAPMWQEGLLQKEARFYSRLAALPARGAAAMMGGELGYRKGLPAMGTLGSGMAKGLASYFVLTQMLNLVTRGKFTWNNPEKGHQMDAWLPTGKGQGFWISPLAVFAEVMHDFIRLGQTKPKTWDVILQMGENRLGPIGKMEQILRTGKSPTGEQYTTTGHVLAGAASQLAPAPIAFGTPLRALGHAIAPNTISPPPRGALMRQVIASLAGVKGQVGETAEQQIFRQAAQFVHQAGLKKSTGWTEVMTDEASYSKLRSAIRNDDMPAARKNFEELLKTHKDTEVLKAMRIWAKRGFTGVKDAETPFRNSLSDAQQEIYHRAQAEKQETLNKFLNFYEKQPVKP